MLSLPVNLARCFWHRICLNFLCSMLTWLVFLSIFYLVVAIERGGGRIGLPEPVVLIMHLSLYVMVLLQSGFSLARGMPSLSDHYTLPVRTSVLVIVNLLNGAIIAMLAYLLIAFAMNWIFAAHWPYLPPALFCGVVSICSLSLAWTLRRFLFASVFAFVVAGVLLSQWLAMRYGIAPAQINDLMPKRLWTELNMFDVIEMSGMVGIAVVVAVVGVALDRRGWTPGLLPALMKSAGVMRAPVGELPTDVEQPNSWSSPDRALFWASSRERGILYPVGSLFATLFVSIWLFMPWSDRVVAFTAMLALPWVGVTLSLFLGMYLGQWSASGRMASFRGTRPVRDDQIASAVLRSLTVGILLSWLIWFGGLSVVVLLFLASGDARIWAGVDDHFEPVGVVLVTTMLCSWAVAANGAAGSLLSASRTGSRFSFTCLGIGFSFFGLMILSAILPDRLASLLRHFVGVTLGVLVIVCAILVFWLAIQRSVLSRRRALVCLLCWFVLSATTLFLLRDSPRQVYAAQISILCSCAALVILPIALCPLAVYWNRHQ